MGDFLKRKGSAKKGKREDRSWQCYGSFSLGGIDRNNNSIKEKEKGRTRTTTRARNSLQAPTFAVKKPKEFGHRQGGGEGRGGIQIKSLLRF